MLPLTGHLHSSKARVGVSYLGKGQAELHRNVWQTAKEAAY